MRAALPVAALIALAGAAGAQPPVEPPAQPPAEQPADRVVVVGIVPVPNVGEGAPYITVGDLQKTANIAGGQMADDTRVKQGFLSCRMSQSALDNRLSDLLPTMERLLENEMTYSGRLRSQSGKAADATKAAEDVRRLAAQGKASQKDVEAAELARQEAINRFDEVRVKWLEAGAAIADFQELQRKGYVESANGLPGGGGSKTIQWADLDLPAMRRKKAGWWTGIPAPDIPKGLAVAAKQVVEKSDKKGSYLEIYGEITNSGASPAQIPKLIVASVDARGWVLGTTEISTSSGSNIPASGSKVFTYNLRSPPGAVVRVTVSFSSKIAPPPRTEVHSPQPPNCTTD